MNARQYKPFSYKINKLPLIVYPVKDENPLQEVFDPSDKTSIHKHLDELYQKHSSL